MPGESLAASEGGAVANASAVREISVLEQLADTKAVEVSVGTKVKRLYPHTNPEVFVVRFRVKDEPEAQHPTPERVVHDRDGQPTDSPVGINKPQFQETCSRSWWRESLVTVTSPAPHSLTGLRASGGERLCRSD